MCSILSVRMSLLKICSRKYRCTYAINQLYVGMYVSVGTQSFVLFGRIRIKIYSTNSTVTPNFHTNCRPGLEIFMLAGFQCRLLIVLHFGFLKGISKFSTYFIYFTHRPLSIFWTTYVLSTIAWTENSTV